MAVHEYGRFFFLVDSHSRPGLRHIVDFEPELGYIDGKPIQGGEPYICSCEDFHFRKSRPCRHCLEVLDYLEPILRHLKLWKDPTPDKKPKPSTNESSIKSKKRFYQLKKHIK